MIRIQIKNQQIISDKSRCIVENSVNHVTCACSFDEEWSGCSKQLIFTNGEVSKSLVVEDGVEFYVPHEVLVHGKLDISAVGYGEGGEKRITTKKMNFPVFVHASGKITGDAPEEYTPELWEQVSAVIGDMSELDTEADTIVEAINKVSKTGGQEDAVPVSRSINGKTLESDISLTAADVGAEAAGTAEKAISDHNTDAAAHGDIRALCEDVTERMSAVTEQMESVSAHPADTNNPHNVTCGQIGAAPGGYGLGGGAAQFSGDPGLVWENGFYQCVGPAPDLPFTRSVIQSLSCDANNYVQIAHGFENPDIGPYARRVCVNGRTNEWEYINPPYEMNVEYRTQEIYQGRPVYTMMIDFGYLPDFSEKTVFTGVDSSQMISITGFATNNMGSWIMLPTADIRLGAGFDMSIAVTTESGGWSDYSAQLIIKYFK